MIGRRVAALLAPVAVVLLSAGSAAGASGHGRIVSAAESQGRLAVVFTATDLPEGATLDPSSVKVMVDGTSVTASVTPLSSVPNPLPKRRVVLVMDTSGSMAGAGMLGARAAAKRFLTEVPADVEVGLIAFADKAHVVVAPTTDRGSVSKAVTTLKAAGNTSLYDGLVLGAKSLGADGERSLIVLSDGADTTSSADAQTATRTLARSGDSVALVAFRTGGAQTAALRAIARATSGVMVAAGDARQLGRAFATAAQSFDTRVAVTATMPAGAKAGNHSVDVAMTFGGVHTSDSATVHVAATGITTGGGSTYVMPGVRSWYLTPLLFLVFLALLSLAVATLVPIRESVRARRVRDLEYYTLHGKPVRVASDVEAAGNAGSIARSVLEFSNRVVERRGWAERMALQLDRAGMALRPHEWLIVRVAVILAAVALFSVVLSNVLLGVVVGGLVGWLGTLMYLRTRASRRVRAFQDGLPDTLQLVASSLQTGFSLPQALDAAVHDGRQPIATELSRALTETQLGAVLEDSLDRIGERMDSKDFKWTVMAIRIQREVGGNLAEVLQTTVATMRERAAMRRQVRALSAEGRLSAYILIALPILLFCWLFLTRRVYISLLWTTNIGLIMSSFAVVAVTIGWFWMRKMVQVEV
jgi:Flp pilus assembly protein TadB/Mg-chelatase subunit ChlD